MLLKVSAIVAVGLIIGSQLNAAPFLASASDNINLVGPNNQWVKTYNYSYDPEVLDIVRTGMGYVIAGSCKANNTDGLLVHVNRNGTVLFTTQIDGQFSDKIESVIQCQNGDFVTIGRSTSSDPEISSTWLVRLTNNGSVRWQKFYEDIDRGHSIVECQDGSYILSASNPHLIHVDENGSVLWSKSYGEWDVLDTRDVVVCDDGGFAFTGYADTGATDEIGYQAWLVRTDSDGTMLWNQTYGDDEFNIGNSLIQCSDSGFAIAGAAGARIFYPRSSWLVRTDENGTLLWERTYSTGYAYSVVECSDGGFGVAGTYARSVIFSSWDALFIRTDEEGNELWRSLCSGPEEDRALSLVLSEDDGFAVVGRTLPHPPEYTIFLWKLTDNYVLPTTLLLLDIVLIVSISAGFIVLVAVIWNRKRRLDRLQELEPVLHVMPRTCSYPSLMD
jgi:hypothetical protein